MRQVIASTIFFLLSTLQAFAEPAFKVSAPHTWKLLDKVSDERMVYSNTSSGVTERIILQSARVIAETEDFQNHLDTKMSELTLVRANFFSQMGMSGYTVLSIENKKSKSRALATYQSIESRFRNLDFSEVQMVERQYFYKSTLYTVTYTVEAPAINNHERVEVTLDYFQPIMKGVRRPASGDDGFTLIDGQVDKLADPTSTHEQERNRASETDGEDLKHRVTERDPASEVARANGARGNGTSVPAASSATTLTAPATEIDTSRPAAAVLDLEINNSATKLSCQGVPVEKRRNQSDPGFVSAFEGILGDGWGCLKGVKDNLWGMVESTAQMAWSAGKYAFSSGYRDQVNSTVGVIYSEIKKSPKEFVKRVGSEIWNTAAKAVGDFKCLNTQEQVREVCDLATNLIPGGILFKVLTKVPLAIADTAKVATMVKAAMGIDKVIKDTDYVTKSAGVVSESSKAATEVARTNSTNLASSTASRAATKPTVSPEALPSKTSASARDGAKEVSSVAQGATNTPTLRSLSAIDQKKLSSVLTHLNKKQASQLDLALRTGGKDVMVELEAVVAKNRSEDLVRAMGEHIFTGKPKVDNEWLRTTMRDLAKGERDASEIRPPVLAASAVERSSGEAARAARTAGKTEQLASVADHAADGAARDSSTTEKRTGAKATDAQSTQPASPKSDLPNRQSEELASSTAASISVEKAESQLLQKVSNSPSAYNTLQSQIRNNPKLSFAEKESQLKLLEGAKKRSFELHSAYGDVLKSKAIGTNDGEVIGLISDLESKGVPRSKIREVIKKVDPNICAVAR